MENRLYHGNDWTRKAKQWRDGKLIEADWTLNYREAKVGDIFRTIHTRKVVTAEDLKRGYMIMKTYRTHHNEDLCHPVFLVPRSRIVTGDARLASMSEWEAK